MPTLLVWHGRKFRFYSSDMAEPPHVHVVKDGRTAKVWLRDLNVAYQRGYNDHEMREVMAVIASNRDASIGAWNDFFGL
jgi:hypothetical protein